MAAVIAPYRMIRNRYGLSSARSAGIVETFKTEFAFGVAAINQAPDHSAPRPCPLHQGIAGAFGISRIQQSRRAGAAKSVGANIVSKGDERRSGFVRDRNMDTFTDFRVVLGKPRFKHVIALLRREMLAQLHVNCFAIADRDRLSGADAINLGGGPQALPRLDKDAGKRNHAADCTGSANFMNCFH